MNATRPALAYGLTRTEDEPSTLNYNEELQLSVDNHGNPVITLPCAGVETFAETDKPQPTTDTRAERDPGDLDGAAWPLQPAAGILTEAARDHGDDEPPDPDESLADDLVTGIVAF
jgi:hypothetical protein